jgi:hypothetical protein
MFHQEFYIYNGLNYQAYKENKTVSMDPRMSRNLGVDKITYSYIS